MLAGILGIGGGVILVPLMTALFSISQHKAHGTSLALVIPVAMTGAVVYALRGDVDWALAATIASGSVVGAIVGAKLMMKVSAYRLQQVLGIYTIAIGLLLLLR